MNQTQKETIVRVYLTFLRLACFIQALELDREINVEEFKEMAERIKKAFSQFQINIDLNEVFLLAITSHSREISEVLADEESILGVYVAQAFVDNQTQVCSDMVKGLLDSALDLVENPKLPESFHEIQLNERIKSFIVAARMKKMLESLMLTNDEE